MSLLIKRGKFQGICGNIVDTTKPIEIWFWDEKEPFVARVICIDREHPDDMTSIALFKVPESVMKIEQVIFFNPYNGEAWAPLTHSDAIVRNKRST